MYVYIYLNYDEPYLDGAGYFCILLNTLEFDFVPHFSYLYPIQLFDDLFCLVRS